MHVLHAARRLHDAISGVNLESSRDFSSIRIVRFTNDFILQLVRQIEEKRHIDNRSRVDGIGVLAGSAFCLTSSKGGALSMCLSMPEIRGALSICLCMPEIRYQPIPHVPAAASDHACDIRPLLL